MAILFLNSVKTSSILNLWKENYFKTTNKQTKGRKKKKKEKMKKDGIWDQENELWISQAAEAEQSGYVCTCICCLPQQHSSRSLYSAQPCGFPGSLPWLTSSPPQTGCAAAEGSVPLTGWILHGSLLYPASSVKLARRHRAWDLSPFQTCLKLASVFKSN